MSAFASVVSSLQRFFAPPVRPTRLIYTRRAHLFAALGAGMVSGAALLVAYYLTLGLLPPAFAYPVTEYPVPAWAHRLDLAQLAGTMLYPPLPTPLTWWLGFAIWGGTLTALGGVYAFLLAWTLQTSDTLKGLGLGAALFVALGLTVTIANGIHPAVMRNAIPDTGVFLLGWSPVATLQLLLVHLLYGGLLGALYGRWSGHYSDPQ